MGRAEKSSWTKSGRWTKTWRKKGSKPCLYLGGTFPGERNNENKCLEVGVCHACEQNSKEANVSGAKERREVLRNEVASPREGRWRAEWATAKTVGWDGRPLEGLEHKNWLKLNEGRNRIGIPVRRPLQNLRHRCWWLRMNYSKIQVLKKLHQESIFSVSLSLLSSVLAS